MFTSTRVIVCKSIPMTIKNKILSNKSYKQKVYRLIMPKHDYRPRLWFRMLGVPFICKKAKGSIIRKSVRLDLLPNHQFIIAEKSIIEDHSLINNAVGDVIIGSNTIIGFSNVIIGPAQIGNNVLFAQHIVLSGLNHNYKDVAIAPVHQGIETDKITIEDNVWVGANCTITAGITIGRHSVIGAGSVVTKDIPSYSVAVGNPAKVIKYYDDSEKQWVKKNDETKTLNLNSK